MSLKGAGFSQGSVAITGGSITPGVVGMSGDVGVSGVNVGVAPTGTMANNGALTLGTALDRTYSEGIWLAYPAGAIAAGVPAATTFYWTVMTSSTGGTVFNSIYTTGVPTVGVQTAFVTTGPGAFTGVTTEVGVTIPVAAGVMGSMGTLESEVTFRNNNSAGNKTGRTRWSTSGGTAILSNTATTVQGSSHRCVISNRTTGSQAILAQFVNVTPTWLVTTVDTTVDTTAATSIFYSVQIGTATDWMLISFSRVKVDRSA